MSEPLQGQSWTTRSLGGGKCSHLHLLSSEGNVGSGQPGWPGELVGKKPGG